MTALVSQILHRIPAIKGPLPESTQQASTSSAYYIVDHHHLALALIRAGVEVSSFHNLQQPFPLPTQATLACGLFTRPSPPPITLCPSPPTNGLPCAACLCSRG